MEQLNQKVKIDIKRGSSPQNENFISHSVRDDAELNGEGPRCSDCTDKI